MRSLPKIATAAAFIAVLSMRPAHAYIDPATGSYVLQVLIAGFLGALLAIKMFWHRILLFFQNLTSRSKADEPSDS